MYGQQDGTKHYPFIIAGDVQLNYTTKVNYLVMNINYGCTKTLVT
jgi:hypothetical protein